MNPPAPLLVCFAVPDEARAFRSAAAALERVEILLVGVGAANATRAIEAALLKVERDSVEPSRSAARHEPSRTESRLTARAQSRFAAVISAGFAGGLHPRLKTGALICQSGDERLLLAGRAAGCEPVRVAYSNRICVTPEEKRALHEATGADAVDMESAALRSVCARAGIPFVNVRVISDAADESLPLDFNRCFTPDLRLQISRVLLELARSPGRLPQLLAFHGTVRRCAVTLSEALTTLIDRLRRDSARVG